MGGAGRSVGAVPGLSGTGLGAGVFGLNTYAFGNGLHTIVWVVTDNGGVASGVGSRYFSIFNSNAQTVASASSAMRPTGADLGRRLEQLPPVAIAGARRAAPGLPAGGPVGAGAVGHRRVRQCGPPSAIGSRFA